MRGIDLTEGDLQADENRNRGNPTLSSASVPPSSSFFHDRLKGEQFAGKDYFFSTGYWLKTHSSHPPSSTETFLKPAFTSCSATRELVASWAQAQYKTIFWSFAYFAIHSWASAGICRCAPCIFQSLVSQSWVARTSTTVTSGFASSSFS